jgi:hypothetical protein
MIVSMATSQNWNKKLMWGNFPKDGEFLSWFSPWKLLGITIGYNTLKLGG